MMAPADSSCLTAEGKMTKTPPPTPPQREYRIYESHGGTVQGGRDLGGHHYACFVNP